jgi:hypothetical protein
MLLTRWSGDELGRDVESKETGAVRESRALLRLAGVAMVEGEGED